MLYKVPQSHYGPTFTTAIIAIPGDAKFMGSAPWSQDMGRTLEIQPAQIFGWIGKAGSQWPSTPEEVQYSKLNTLYTS